MFINALYGAERRPAMNRMVVGIDLGDKQNCVCALDYEGTVVERCTVKKLCKRYENKPSSDFSFNGEGGKECKSYEEVNRWDLLNMYMLGHK